MDKQKLFFVHDDDNGAEEIDHIDDDDDVDEECSEITLWTPEYNNAVQNLGQRNYAVFIFEFFSSDILLF